MTPVDWKKNISRQKIKDWVLALNPRERVVVGLAAAAVLFYAVSLPISGFQTYVEDTKREVEVRKRDLTNLNIVLSQYARISKRLEDLKATFAASQMSFEEVYLKLDDIVKQSIGSDNYDLKKTRQASQINPEYEKQEYALKVRALKLNQLVDLLHKIEHGAGPIFLARVDVVRSDTQEFSATLEMFSIRRIQTA